MKIKVCFLIFLSILFIVTARPVYADSPTVGFWVEDSTYDFFDPTKNPESKYNFEQWADRQMYHWNEMLEKAGIRFRMKINKIVRVKDGALPLGNKENFPTNDPDSRDKSIDLPWGFPKSWLDLEIHRRTHENLIDDLINGVDWGLFHELSHKLSLVDEYLLNIEVNRDKIEVTDPTGKTLIGNYIQPANQNQIYLTKLQGLMNSHYEQRFYSEYSSHTLNGILNAIDRGEDTDFYHKRRWLDDIPKDNVLRILGMEGKPIEGALINIYQSVFPEGGEYGAKRIDNIADITSTTDKDGQVSIGSNPFGHGNINLQSAPSDRRKISRTGLNNGLFILEISKSNLLEYQIVEFFHFSLAYWAGATERAVYDIRTNFSILPTPTPTQTPTPTPTRAPDLITKLLCQNECSTKKEGNDLTNCLTSCYAKYRNTPTSTPTPIRAPTATLSPTSTPISIPPSAPTPTPTPIPAPNITIRFKYLDLDGNSLLETTLNGQRVGVTVKELPSNKIILDSIPLSLMLPLSNYINKLIEVSANPIPGYTISSSICFLRETECEPDSFRSKDKFAFLVPSFLNESIEYIDVSFKYTPTLVSPTTTPTLIPAFTPDQASTPTPTLSLETLTPTPFQTLYYTPTSPEPTPTLPPTVALPTSTPTPSPEAPTSTPTPVERKRIIGISINGAEIDIINPTIAINLPVVEGQEGTFVVPVIVTYSDETAKQFNLVFHYKPSLPSTAEPTPISISPTPTYTIPTPTSATYDQCKSNCYNITLDPKMRETCIKNTCEFLRLTPTPTPIPTPTFIPTPTQTKTPTPTPTKAPTPTPTKAPTPTPFVPAKACTYYYECTDGNPCTTDSCNQGKCSYNKSPVGTVCERGRDYPYDPIKQCDIFGACIKL